MRLKTAILSALLTTFICIFPGIVTYDIISAILTGSIVSFLSGMFLYSYQDPIYDSPIDGKAIIAANLVGCFFAPIVVSNGYWQAFWLTGTTVVLALVTGAFFIFLSVRLITASNKEAFELMDKWFQARIKNEDGHQ